MALQSGILLGSLSSVAPLRIISLVPSLTELLFHLGLEERVVGITKFCVHPPHWLHSKRRIGGTKQINLDEILALKPDLVIANKEENVKEQVEALSQKGIAVYVSEVKDINDAYGAIADIGFITGTEEKSNLLNNSIKTGFIAMPVLPPISFVYFMWHNPYMVAGADTFISELCTQVGWHNAMHHHNRYPEVSLEMDAIKNADVLFFSSEPFPFQQKHIEALPVALQQKAILVDGEMMSWYGSRLLQAAAYFTQLSRQINNLSKS